MTWYLLLAFLLLLLNGFFVASEFAIVKVRSTQVESLAARGLWRARLAQHVLRHLDSYLSATQLGITLTSLGLGWIGEPVFAFLLEQPLRLVGLTDATMIRSIAVAAGFACLTFLHIVIGELAPKSLAIRHARAITLSIALPLRIFHALFYPAIFALNGAANGLIKLVGIEPASEHEITHSEEELRLVLAGRSGKDGATPAMNKLLINVLDLVEVQVRDIMIPRPRIVHLSTRRTLEQNLAIVHESGYSRYPLCDDDLDHVIGLVHFKDIYQAQIRERGPFDLRKLKRTILFVPETMRVQRLLTTLLSSRTQMAIAVDEYGHASGLVALEDVIEEIVGEIRDEFDEENPAGQEVRPGEYVVDGLTPLHDLYKLCGLSIDGRGVTTIGGYVVQHFGTIPGEGAHLRIGDFDVEVKKAGKRRVHQVLLRRLTAAVKPPAVS
ncbi:MAG: hemolysin family protein [Planctomycetota bacterium]